MLDASGAGVSRGPGAAVKPGLATADSGLVAVYLHLARDCPRYPAVQVCREAVGSHLLPAATLAATAAGGALWAAFAARDATAALCGAVLAGCCALPAAQLFLRARRAAGPEAWVLRWSPDGFLLNLRSFERGGRPPTHPTIAWIPAGSVRAARARRLRPTAPRAQGGGLRQTGEQWLRTREFLDLHLDPADTARLAEALACEQRERDRGSGAAGRSRHVPAWVPEPGVLRIAWRGASSQLTPALPGVLEAMGPHVTVLEPVERRVRYPKLGRAELDAHLRDLAQAGDVANAVAIAQVRYRLSLRRARQRVAALEGRDRAPLHSAA